jgi:YidC/Oxa1 family membrane protein insertase
MNKDDLPRYALYGAIALLSFMLLVEWARFSEANRPPPPQPTATATVPGDDLAPGELPDATINDEALGDIPDQLEVPLEPAADPESRPAEQTLAAPTRLIKVETDTQRLAIDLNGGDIVELALLTHYAKLDRPDLPFVLLRNDAQQTYVAQSGLIGPDGIDKANQRARYTAAQRVYRMADGNDRLVVELRHEAANDVTVLKRFVFTRGSHVIDVEHEVINAGDAPWTAGMFAQLRRDASPAPGLDGNMFSINPYLGFASRTADEPYKKLDFDDLEDGAWKATVDGGWIAMVQHYFISAWVPDDGPHAFTALQSQSGLYLGRFTSPAVRVEPGSSAVLSGRFYAGPKDQYRLQEIAPGLDLTVDYGFLWWIAQPLFVLLNFFATGHFHAFGLDFQFGGGLGNWGVSIILLTVLIKALFFQLSATSYKSMARMRKLQPKLIELRERYADDKAKQSEEMMNLYRKEKVNPLGGCLPILIQMPVFIALYWMLMESVELRHAPFFLWIRDLSVMDPYFVLPLLMGASMFVQMKLNPPPPDPMQARIMQLMPFVFTVFFLWFPAGLVLYWLVNNLLSIAQQWVITRQIERGG